MQNFTTSLTLTAIDKITPVVKTIETNLKSLTSISTQVTSSFNNASYAAQDFGNRLKVLALATVGVITGVSYMTFKYSENAEALLLMSQRTGVTTDQIQKLGYAAEQTGVSAESMDMGLKFLNRSIGIAGTAANSDAAVAFAALGVQVRDANGQLKSADKVLLEISDKFQHTADGAQKVYTAMTLMGRQGTSLIPLLDKGSEAIRVFGDQFQRYGVLLSQADLEKAARFNDDVKTMSVAFKGLTQIISGALVPVFDPIVQGFSNFIAENKDLVRLKTVEYVEMLVHGLGYLWNVLGEVSAAIGRAISFFGGFRNVLIGIVGLKIGELAASFARLTSSIITLAGAIAGSPLGAFLLMLTAIAAAIYEINKAFPELGKTIIGTTKNMLKEIDAFFQYLIQKWQQVEKVYNKLTGKKTYTMDEYNKLVKPHPKGMTADEYKDIGGSTTKAKPVPVQVVPAATPAETPLSYASIDNPISNVGPSRAASQGKQNLGFDGLLNMLTQSINTQKNQLQMHIKLDTQNKVTGLSVNTPNDMDVAVDTGSMF